MYALSDNTDNGSDSVDTQQTQIITVGASVREQAALRMDRESLNQFESI